MSANPPKQASHHNSEHRRSSANRNPVPSELESVNVRLTHLKDSVLPASPYLLTVPTDIPFRLGSRFVNNWAVGKKGPFAAEEQQLQYMTFLMHHDADSLLVAVGDWSDNNGGIMAKTGDNPPTSVSDATSTPPTNGVVKKKISLSDYKTKAEKESTRKTPDKPQQPSRNDTKSDRPKPPPAPVTKDRATPEPAPENPKRETGSKRPSTASLDKSEDAPASKRLRPSPRPSDVPPKSQSSGKKIPALLSPTLPPTSTASQLPELLSPTLPPFLEEELAQIEDDLPPTKQHSSNKRDTSAVFSKAKDDIPATKSADKLKLQPEARFVSKSSQKEPQNKNASSGLSTAKPNLSHRNAVADTASPHREKSPSKAATMKRNASNSTETMVPKRLIVKLRYGRANRRRVEALLRFVGKRKVSENTSHKLSRESYSENEDLDTRDAEDRHREKRLKPSGDEKPSMAGKTVPPEKGRVPSSTALKSSSQAMKTTHLTPVKDTPGNTRGRDSREAEARTPVSLSSAKGVASSTEKAAKAPSAQTDVQPSSREDERRAWRDEFQKYAGLGRELKHIADRYSRAKASNEHSTIADEKLAAASGIESILCFIVAFIADDRSKALSRQIGDSDKWRSIIAYWKVVRTMTKRFPHLRGLCLILGAVSHDAINSLDMERLAVCAVPGEQSPVPTPGSEENAFNSDKNKPHRREFLDLKNRLPENFRDANRLWLEGCRELSDDVLAAEYPETWSKRSRNYAERGVNKFKAGSYAGEYFLPFGRTTTPMEAVRFGVAFLQEWCKSEGLEFEARLTLS